MWIPDANKSNIYTYTGGKKVISIGEKGFVYIYLPSHGEVFIKANYIQLVTSQQYQ
jgi:hypothetical protein